LGHIARLNTRLSADRLIEESEIIAESVDKGGVRIVSAFYSPETGEADLV
jgi:carbonic anhydrase